MSDYLKVFATQADYDAYIASDYPKPNVSYIEATDETIFTNYADSGADSILAAIAPEDWPSSLTTWQISSAVTEVIVPEGVTTIGRALGENISGNIFKNFTVLEKVTLPSTLTTVNANNVTDGIFYGCTSLTSINLEDTSVTALCKGMFNGCTSLTEIALPSTLTEIKEESFRDCTALTSVDIPSGVIGTIGGLAFYGCTALTNVDIPSGVTLLGSQCFGRCTALTSLTVRATTPPTVGFNALSGINQNVVIYVPAESVETYKAASGWSAYASNIQAIPA